MFKERSEDTAYRVIMNETVEIHFSMEHDTRPDVRIKMGLRETIEQSAPVSSVYSTNNLRSSIEIKS